LPFRTFPEAISKLRLSSEIPEQEKNALLGQGQIRHVSSNQNLFRTGDAIEHFYIICCGAIKLVCETADGKEVTTDISILGQTIGTLSTFEHSQKRHRVSAIAIQDSTVLEFSADWLKNAAHNPVIALDILSNISQYVHMIELEVEQKSTMSSAQRLACFLQRLCMMHDFDPQGFTLPYSKSLIASRLGIQPETFSRTLNTLDSHGISVQDSHVVFHDIEAIEKFSCEHCTFVGDCSTHQDVTRKLPKT
jgi:CRP-like cAMP-binding protein